MNQEKVANLLRKKLATFSGKISNLILRVPKSPLEELLVPLSSPIRAK